MDFNCLNNIGWGFVDRSKLWRSEECRARSACTNVQSDRALHSRQHKFVAPNEMTGLS